MMPIKTTREGNKITKVCVEDSHKLINAIENIIDVFTTNSKNLCNMEPVVDGNITGIGVAECLDTDEFSEDTGNEIAFRKAKLSANLKKLNLLRKVLHNLTKAQKELDKLRLKFIMYVMNDTASLKSFNNDFNLRLEEEDLDVITSFIREQFLNECKRK